MADGVLIETISKQVFTDMQKLIEQLQTEIKLTNELSAAFKKVKLPSQTTKAAKDAAKALKDTDTAIKKVAQSETQLQKAREAQIKKESDLRQRLASQRKKEASDRERQVNKESQLRQRLIVQRNKEEAATKKLKDSTNRLSGAYAKEQAKLNQLRKVYKDLAIRKELNNNLSRREELLLKRTRVQLTRKEAALRKVDAQMRITNRNVGNYSSALSGLGGSVSALVGGFGLFTAMRIGQDIFTTVRALDALNKALLKVTGSQAALTETQFFLNELADQGGVDILSLTKAYTKFFASAKNTNLSLEDTRKIFANTALAGASLGLSTDDVTGAMRALEQMLSKGNVQAEEIRGQLGERLPGAFQILAKSMGLTTQELNKQLELGNVLAEEVLP